MTTVTFRRHKFQGVLTKKISRMQWQSTFDNVLRGYDFEYDELNRLTMSSYADDDLTYQYNGNQIQNISDRAGSLLYNGSFDFKDGANESTEYFYNANGALTKDLNKGISKIEYDMLDNLSSIIFNNGFKTKYVYDTHGNKLRTTHEALTTNTTDYIGNVHGRMP